MINLKKMSLIIAAGLSISFGVQAQRISDLPQTTKEYIPVSIQVAPVGLPAKVEGKVLVVDIFNYGCFHCKTIHPLLEEVYNKYGDKIQLVKISAPFKHWNEYTHLFYALDKLGVERKVSSDIFQAIHQERERDLSLGSKKLKSILAKHNISEESFEKAWKDPNIAAKVQNSIDILRAYKIDSTPAIVVDNEKSFSPQFNGGYKEAAKAVDTAIALSYAKIERERAQKNKK